MSNTLNSTKITSPENKQETVAHFSIDTPSTPFVMKNVVSLADDYVFSCFVKSDSTGSFKIGNKQVATSNKWTEVKIPFTVSSNGNPDIAIYFTVNGQYYFYHTQVERGEVPTKWQPSPDDVDEDIQSVSTTQQASIEAMPGKIMAQVAEQYATKTDFSNITQRADSISTTVARVNNKINDGSEIISTINQTAEDVSINANKINLNGVVTANNNFKILSDGSMKANNGTFNGIIKLNDNKTIIDGKGGIGQLSFSSNNGYNGFSVTCGGLNVFGYNWYQSENTNYFPKAREVIGYYIPKNFTIYSAKICMAASAIQWYNGLGYPKNIAAYCTDSSLVRATFANMNQRWVLDNTLDTSNQIKNAFNGNSTWTPTLYNNSSIVYMESSDIKSYLKSGFHNIVFATTDNDKSSFNDAQLGTGFFRAFLFVIGYYKFI